MNCYLTLNQNECMREVIFSRNNESKWKEIEQYLSGHRKATADELADYYIQVNDDLSYAKTFYPSSNLVNYLNKIALGLHRKIYKNKKEKKSRFKHFWKYEVPIAMREGHKELLYAFIVFVVAIAVGVFSSMYDDSFVRLILGDSYVNMTLNNINEGDPMGVYRSHSQGSMFFGIAINNVRVSFLAFAFGIMSSVMTGYILFQNGIMVGAFQYFFIQKGLGWISFSTIFLHGALELSAIVIAGAAGMIIGNSWMFPGTYSRGTSLMMGAKRALKVIIGLVPVFIVAAIIESFITRLYQDMPSILRSAIILLSFAWILYYFVWLPIKLEREGLTSDVEKIN